MYIINKAISTATIPTIYIESTNSKLLREGNVISARGMKREPHNGPAYFHSFAMMLQSIFYKHSYCVPVAASVAW